MGFAILIILCSLYLSYSTYIINEFSKNILQILNTSREECRTHVSIEDEIYWDYLDYDKNNHAQ